VFIHVGSKFGGEEIRKKIFMTPAQMYNNLIEYLQASAFAQGFGIGLPEDDDSRKWKGFWDANAISAELNL
jgi:hypothetical protein